MPAEKYKVNYQGSPNKERLKGLRLEDSKLYHVFGRQRITAELIEISALGKDLVDKVSSSKLRGLDTIFIKGPIKET